VSTSRTFGKINELYVSSEWAMCNVMQMLVQGGGLELLGLQGILMESWSDAS
jgi:hypothetical protein